MQVSAHRARFTGIIEPNTEHEDFSHSQELLLLLPPAPFFVPVSVVKSDMGCDGYMLGESVNRLNRMGINVAVMGSGGHKELALARETLPFAKFMGEKYCRLVYGE